MINMDVLIRLDSQPLIYILEKVRSFRKRCIMHIKGHRVNGYYVYLGNREADLVDKRLFQLAFYDLCL